MPEPRGLGEQVVEPGRTVEHRVLGVDVQVDERVVAGSHRTHSSAAHATACSRGDVRTAPRAARQTGIGRRAGAQACPDSRTVSAYCRSCGYSLATVTRSPVRGVVEAEPAGVQPLPVEPERGGEPGSAP